MFQAVIDAVVPVFGLILLGWFVARRGLLAPGATDALNRFVIYLALPCLLFLAMARSELDIMSELGFVISFATGTLVTTLAYLWLSRREGLAGLTRSINGMSASYTNVGFMGIPLVLMVFGEEALAPVVIGCILTVAVQFGLTIIAIEIQKAKGGSLLPAVKRVALSLLKNPILVAPSLGAAFSALDVLPPQAVLGMIDLLAAAATPCALVTIGLFLAQSKVQTASPAVMQIVLLKLFLHPVIVAILAIGVFDLNPVWAWTAIMAAALPVGTGPFMLANLYQQDAAVSARAILISTVASAVTLSLMIAWLNYQGVI